MSGFRGRSDNRGRGSFRGGSRGGSSFRGSSRGGSFRGGSRGGSRGGHGGSSFRGSSRGGSRGGRGGRGGSSFRGGNMRGKSVRERSHFEERNTTNVGEESDSAPEEAGVREFADDGIDSEANSAAEGESDEGFFDSDDEAPESSSYKNNKNHRGEQDDDKKKKNKHAPKETKISHRPVGVVRDIPGLDIKKDYAGDGSYSGGLYGNRDVRFDTALGRSVDYEVVRKQYAFLDEYREKEIKEMEGILRNKKLLSRMDENEIEELKYKLQSTKSKLQSLQKKDKEKEALKTYLREQKQENGGMKFLTRAEKRKVVLVDRFESMDSRQKNKSIERKRKRKLGKEMRALEFGRQ